MKSFLQEVSFGLSKKNKDYNDENTNRTWGYPITPVVFILANIWFLTYLSTKTICIA